MKEYKPTKRDHLEAIMWAVIGAALMATGFAIGVSLPITPWWFQ